MNKLLIASIIFGICCAATMAAPSAPLKLAAEGLAKVATKGGVKAAATKVAKYLGVGGLFALGSAGVEKVIKPEVETPPPAPQAPVYIYTPQETSTAKPQTSPPQTPPPQNFSLPEILGMGGGILSTLVSFFFGIFYYAKKQFNK